MKCPCCDYQFPFWQKAENDESTIPIPDPGMRATDPDEQDASGRGMIATDAGR